MKEIEWSQKPVIPDIKEDGTGGSGRAIGLRPPSKREDADQFDPDDISLSKEAEADRKFSPRKYGGVDQTTLESLCVAVFLRGKNDEKLEKAMRIEREKEAEALAASPIKSDYFENSFLGTAYDWLRSVYLETRQLVGFTDAGMLSTGRGDDPNSVELYKDELHECYAAMLIRQVRSNVLIEQMSRRYRSRMARDLFQQYQRDCKDPRVGPDKALSSFRESVITKLGEQEAAAIQEHDWIDEHSKTLQKLVDMKDNPEKYMGYLCGIDAIDSQIKGFRPGHLTVFVGMHGGFKSTMMLNVGYGLWKQGYNVLYASLEMEAELMQIKLWCRATERTSFSKLYNGLISDPSDWEKMDRLEEALQKETDPVKYKDISYKLERLKNALNGLDRTKAGEVEDSVLINKFYETHQKSPNKFKIINVGQSNKIRLSQIERWLKEKAGSFKPHVVIVDYLSLVAPETTYNDRRDLELGDICKYFRQMGLSMGFSCITAAQFKRAAIERIRKSGLDTPEKAQVGTDDIAESNQIGADADEVIMLFRGEGGNRLKMLTTKSRHGATDTETGLVLQVKPDMCLIGSGEGMEDTALRAGRITVGQGMEKLGDTRKFLDGSKTPDDDFFCYGDDHPGEYSGDDMSANLMIDTIDLKSQPKIRAHTSTADDLEDDI